MMKKRNLFIICLAVFITAGFLNTPKVAAQTENSPSDTIIYKDFKTEHVWDARIAIADMIMLGESKRGMRRIIPITGGTFEGAKIKGEVLSGGEDWQLVRPDGDTELYARYLLKTDDGVIIQVINQVLIHMPVNGEKTGPYIRSVVDIEAPNDSKYDYLNHAIFIGTLTVPVLKPGEKPCVIIGVYKLL